MNNKLTKQQFMQICIMLFGLFFGAGNLIFPPFMGKEAGFLSPWALGFFAITAIIFPILGVIVVARTKGLRNLALKVSPWFALAYTACIYLSIGPGLGIPRAGSTPFTFVIEPHLSGSSVLIFRVVYTFIFFLVAYWLCLTPSKMVRRMGKFLTPSLLILIFALFLGVIIKGANSYTAPINDYAKNVYVTGFLNGYNTMDTVAALNFGLVIAIAMGTMNISDDKKVVKYSIKAGYVAGLLLLIVYGMLTYVGTATAGMFPNTKNGAEVLTKASLYVFGNVGNYILGLIFTLACLTTCVGLITSTGQYFSGLTKIPYKTWVIIWTVASFALANFGLDFILKFSVPVLLIIYPVSLMIIVMGLMDNLFFGNKTVYKATIYVCLIFSIVDTIITTFKLNIPFITDAIHSLPLSKYSLGWVTPSLIVFVLGIYVTRIINSSKNYEE